MDIEAKEAFVNKVDAFAATLNPEEQAMLIELLVGNDEVTGFGTGWPGLGSLLPNADTVASSASANPEGVFVAGRTYTADATSDSSIIFGHETGL